MAALVLKNLPQRVHSRLKQEADRNRRSMAQEAITILERSLGLLPPVRLSKPIKTLKPVTGAMVISAIRSGRK